MKKMENAEKIEDIEFYLNAQNAVVLKDRKEFMTYSFKYNGRSYSFVVAHNPLVKGIKSNTSQYSLYGLFEGNVSPGVLKKYNEMSYPLMATCFAECFEGAEIEFFEKVYALLEKEELEGKVYLPTLDRKKFWNINNLRYEIPVLSYLANEDTKGFVAKIKETFTENESLSNMDIKMLEKDFVRTVIKNRHSEKSFKAIKERVMAIFKKRRGAYILEGQMGFV